MLENNLTFSGSLLEGFLLSVFAVYGLVTDCFRLKKSKNSMPWPRPAVFFFFFFLKSCMLRPNGMEE